jgi:exosortase/archaeosortase family protein
LYHVILFPLRFPDKQLTILTAQSAGFIYKHLSNENSVFDREEIKKGYSISVLYIDNRRAIGIADGCNGLELYVLYIGFLLCIPTSAKKQVLFILTGVAGIFILNAFRCFGLAWLFLNNYAIANFAHHYLFKMIIYGCVFYTWDLYAKKYIANVR